MAKKKNTEQAVETVVYCGPTIPGVATQNTFYNNGIPVALEEEIEKYPPMRGLVIPLEDLPEVSKKLNGHYGHVYRLYRLVQAKF